MELPIPLALGLLAAMASLGFLCALAETALFSLGRWQVRELRESRGMGARVAGLLERPEEVLSALSLGNTLANGMLLVMSLLVSWQQDWPWMGVLGGVLLVVLVVGEILPKTLAVRAPAQWSLRVAPGVQLLVQITRPLLWMAGRVVETVFGWLRLPPERRAQVTEEEYHELLDMAVQQGALATAEREIIGELITLDRKQVRDVMRPRATMAALADDLPPDQLVRAARRHRHRRLPVYDETPDTIVGVLNTHQLLLDPEHRFDDAIEFPSFVPETMNLLQLFRALQQQRRNLAVVLDEFGAVSGVVRMEDILTEVLGEMSGDGPARGFVFERLGRGRWRASGSMRLSDFRREYPALPWVPEVETLGGMLMAQLDLVPAQGATAEVHGLRLTAQVVDERRVLEVLVETPEAR
jgi:CBS domain containing-hemolysin-like protein